MVQNLTFSQLLDVLTDLIDKKSNGTLYIRSESNHIITIGLEKGKIYALFYGPKRGRNAIPMIEQISTGSYKFEATVLTGISHELPTTPEIINRFRTRKNTYERTGASTVTGKTAASISQEKRDRLCQQLKSLLAEHLGPIAEMVFDDALEESADFCATPDQAQALINKLSIDIENTIEVEQFRNKADEAINNMLKS